MYTSRGCAFGKCSFCYLVPYQKVSLQPLWRARSAKSVVDELEYLTSELGVKRVTFVDEDYFGTNGDGVQRTLEIAKLILDRGVEVKYYVNALVKSLLFVSRQGHLPLLAESGLDSVFAGFESTSREVLVSYHKPQRPEQYDEVIDSLLAYDIRINPGLITFSEKSTLEEVIGNIDLARRMRYYDLFLFTRRLVDLSASIIDDRSASMASPTLQLGWLEYYRQQHAAEERAFEDARVASLFQIMRILCNLLFEKFAETGLANAAPLKRNRSALIAAHYASFYETVDWVRSHDRYVSFEEAYSWARNMTSIVANEIHAVTPSAPIRFPHLDISWS
jgi:radical SAM family protein